MRPHDVLLTALSSMAQNKMRAGLTLLGIVIGVTAVIVLMALGRGVQQSITSQIEALGSNLLSVTPGSAESGGGFAFLGGGGGGEGSLTMEDAYALLDPLFAPSISAVAPQKESFGRMIARGNETRGQIIGVTPEYETVRNSPVAMGQFISHGHVLDNSNVAVLGANIADALFGQRDPFGEPIRIEDEQFTVIGVQEEQGLGFFGFVDEQVYIPITTHQHRLSSNRTAQGGIQVDSINVQVSDSLLTDRAIDEITTLLRLRHELSAEDENDFTVSDQREVLEAVQEATNAFVIFLVGIAGISLLVGGIGIMNIMLVSVTERTREIGIRKAMGAKRRDILMQFVTEASMLSFGGGLIGLALGVGISSLLDGAEDAFGPGADLIMVVTGDIVALALSVSIMVGLFFGIYPALRAARLRPIDALRHE